MAKKLKIDKKYLFRLFMELRKRIIRIILFYIINTAICYHFRGLLYDILMHSVPNIQFVYLGVWDAFLADISISFYAAFFATLPIIIYHMYAFCAPALKQTERRLLSICIAISLVMICLSFYLLLFYVLPAITKSLLYQTQYYIPLLSINAYIATCMHLLLYVIIVFQFPIVLLVLISIKLITVKQLQQIRKHIFILFLIISAIITPPDVISQIVLTIILMLVYELTIYIIKYYVVRLKNKSR